MYVTQPTYMCSKQSFVNICLRICIYCSSRLSVFEAALALAFFRYKSISLRICSPDMKYFSPTLLRKLVITTSCALPASPLAMPTHCPSITLKRKARHDSSLTLKVDCRSLVAASVTWSIVADKNSGVSLRGAPFGILKLTFELFIDFTFSSFVLLTSFRMKLWKSKALMFLAICCSSLNAFSSLANLCFICCNSSRSFLMFSSPLLFDS
mmetsp:Transcript_61980/g.202162  ORF Transcript_61980/g.202162 Transcript_61980/m.202162 type:complete len:210 (+) Transcript_61980:376-1005(+)